MADHDQLFKVLLREFFAEFFQLFFPEWAARFDFTRVEWLDKEIFLDPPHGEKRSVDLIARLPTLRPVTPDTATWLALVHVEVESADKVAPLRRRVFEYFEYLRRLYDLPVLPIGLYLRVGLDGVGWDVYEETFWEHTLVRFTYPYVGLPALDAENYLHGTNWLGVALTALMRVPPERRLEVGQQAWRRLVQCPENDYRRYLLCECVDTYVPVDTAQRQQFEDAMLTDPDPGVRTMSLGVLQKYRQQGKQEGRQEAQRETFLMLLEARFGALTSQVRERVAALPPEKIQEALVAFARGQSLQELGLEG